MPRRRKNNGTFTTFSLWGSGLLILGIFLFLIFFSKKEDLRKDGCLRNEPPPVIQVYYLDISDPLNIQQREKIKKKFETDIKELPTFGKLVVYFSNSQSDKLVSVYSKCKPKTFDEKNLIEQGGSNKRIDEMRYHQFQKMLANLLSNISSISSQRSSPILENLDLVVAREFPSLEIMMKNPQKYKLILISDLLQNSEGISVFRGLISPEEALRKTPFAFTGRVEYNELVAYKYIQYQNNELRKWWYEVFSVSGSIISGKGLW